MESDEKVTCCFGMVAIQNQQHTGSVQMLETFKQMDLGVEIGIRYLTVVKLHQENHLLLENDGN